MSSHHPGVDLERRSGATYDATLLPASVASGAAGDGEPPSPGRPAPAPPPPRHEGEVDPARVSAWLAAAVTLVVGLLALDGLPVGVMRDDGMYVVLAKAIASGEGFRWIHLPGAPEATHFPPGYPLLLAALWSLWPEFPANVMLFKAANALCMAASAGLLVHLAHRRLRLDLRASLALAIVACIGVPTLVLSTVVMSEPLFLALALWTLLRLERQAAGEPPSGTPDDDAGTARHALADAAATGLLVGLAMLVRTHGIALLAAALLVFVLRRRWREALVLGAVPAVIVLPWMLWVAAYDGLLPPAMRGNYASYSGWLLDALRADGPMLLVHSARRGLGELAGMFATLFAPGMPPAVRVTALVALAALAAVGARELWRRAPVTALFLAAYLAIVVLWPFSPTRFVWAVWPLVMLVLVAGIAAAWRWRPAAVPASALRHATLAGALLLAAGHAGYGVRAVRGEWWSSIPRRASQDLEPLLEWVQSRTAPDQVVGTTLEGIVYLYGGRQTMPLAAFTTGEYFREPVPAERAIALREILRFRAPDVVVVTPASPRSVLGGVALLTQGPRPSLVLRDSFPAGYVFAPSAAAPAGALTRDP